MSLHSRFLAFDQAAPKVAQAGSEVVILGSEISLDVAVCWFLELVLWFPFHSQLRLL